MNDDAVTAAKVENAINTTLEFVVPAGGIIMWSGSTASIPSGWAICDGNNGTPDLRDRFVVGAGSTYGVNATGGSANAVLIAHSHSITDPGHDHTWSTRILIAMTVVVQNLEMEEFLDPILQLVNLQELLVLIPQVSMQQVQQQTDKQEPMQTCHHIWHWHIS